MSSHRARGTVDAEHGAALTIVLLATGALLSLGLGFATLAATETAIAGHHRASTQVFYAADAAAEVAAGELLRLDDWNRVLDGTRRSAVIPGSLPASSGVDVAAETAVVQAEMAATPGFGSGAVVWRPFASGDVSALLPSPPSGMRAFVVWTADDAADVDGDPARDSNGVILLLARAFGSHGTRRTIVVSLVRREIAAGGETDGEDRPMTSRIQSWWEVQ